MRVAHSAKPSRSLLTALAGVCSAVLLAFLAVPCLSLLLNVRSGEIWQALREDYVRQALVLTLRTSILAALLCAILGTPVAYVLARGSFPGKRVVDALVQLPLVLPPVVSGVALLMAFGRRGLLGAHLSAWGIEIPFTAAAVVMAQVFMAAPFFVVAVRNGLAAVPPTLEEASRTLGASELRTFARVTLPLTWPAFASGLVLCWGRAIGEFGATITFAGNMPGTTRTMTLAVLTAMQGDLNGALVLSVLLLVFSSALFLAAAVILQPLRLAAHA